MVSSSDLILFKVCAWLEYVDIGLFTLVFTPCLPIIVFCPIYACLVEDP